MPGLRKYFGDLNPAYLWNAASWRWISVRSADYMWTVSAADSNAYYLRRTDGSIPDGLYHGNLIAEMALRGTPLPISNWPLAAGTWRSDDQDGLGKPTLYVRLPLAESSPDPDALLLDALTYRSVPTLHDAVIFDDLSGDAVEELDRVLSCALLITTSGYRGTLGSREQSLVVEGAADFFLDGSGTYRLALREGQTISPQVHIGSQSARGPTVYLRSTYSDTVVRIQSGTLYMPDKTDATSHLQRLEVWGNAQVVLDRGLTMTGGTIIQNGGTAIYRQAMVQQSTVTIERGRVDFQEPFSLSHVNSKIVLRDGSAAIRTTQPIRTIQVVGNAARIPELQLNTGVELNVNALELRQGLVRTTEFNGPAPAITLDGEVQIQAVKL